MREYDFVIIGGGAAGFACAVKLSELSGGDARITLINSGWLGGTCVNVGCVPSKALIEAGKLAFESSRARTPGIRSITEIAFEEVMGWIRGTVNDLRREEYESLLERLDNVELVRGRASFRGDGSLIVEQDERNFEIKGRRYLISTGSRPTVPPIEGLEEAGYVTSDEMWKTSERPESLMVVGAGAIGVEIGRAMNRLGVKTTMVEVLDRVLPGIEPELSKVLTDVLRKEGVKVYTKTRVVRVRKKGERKVIELATGEGREEEEVEQVLVATGRSVNTDGRNLEDVEG